MEPAWLDTKEYPFTNRYLNIDGHKIHYIDEGKGDTILFVHGIPDWSFGWREQIKMLSKNYRCVAPDHLGFGLSDKTESAELTIAAHAERLKSFIHQLYLKNIHFVVHDFGGPIGLSYAIEEPQNIKSITLFNTWMWPLKGIKHFDTGDKVVNNWFGKFLYLQLNFSVRFMLKNSYADKKNLPAEIYNHYLAPMQSREARWAAYTLAKSLVGEHTHMQYLWHQRHRLKNIPMHILWGMKDKFVPAVVLLPTWKENFPDSRFTAIENAGHFVQEEAGEVLAEEISKFIASVPEIV
ncbi:MAG: alpha/beta fold hydrolase [Bacteroidota bacterium]